MRTFLNFPKSKIITAPNRWDLTALCVVFAILVLFAWGARQMVMPYQLGQPIPISLSIKVLPKYALLSVLRMGIAMFCSIVFTFIFGAWAAKSRQAERIIVPLIDILQSVPILGFLSITLPAFIALFPGSLLGPECAAIFVIFTSQVWNITLSFYQSLKTIPEDLKEAARILQLSWWQRFWRLEVSFAMPSLLWNAMLSMSASWFFLVASEAISVANQDIALPGIGSYIALAIQNKNLSAIGFAIFAMAIVILLYDQLIFRPLLNWALKFNLTETDETKPAKFWWTNIFKRSRLFQVLGSGSERVFDAIVNVPFRKRAVDKTSKKKSTKVWVVYLVNSVIIFSVLISLVILGHFILKTLSLQEVGRVILLGSYTGLRVIILISLCSFLWIPVGVWIGFRPNISKIVQPFLQFLAAFPNNLFFPLFVFFIVTFHLNVEIWLTPLMILGTQWYILFNVIVGASALPKELNYATKNFGVKGWLFWKRFILPGIFPYYITGAITAAGGSWNASIIAEVVNWGNTTLTATGLGSYIQKYTTVGDFPRIALGITVMCLFVLAFNRVVWKPLYDLTEKRFQ